LTAPEILHSRWASPQTRCLLSGARRHTRLDYDPADASHSEFTTNGEYNHFSLKIQNEV